MSGSQSEPVAIGAVVLELLAYNWEWKGISEVYFNATSSVGDIHHFGWRAKHPRWAQYLDEDEARYAHWTPEECSSRSAAESRLSDCAISGKLLIIYVRMQLAAVLVSITCKNIGKLWCMAKCMQH